MITQKIILSFNKESDNRWYVVCPQWEEEQTKLFRETFTYVDENGKIQKYEEVLNPDNPLDDHTKNPMWKDPHNDLIMDETFEVLLDSRLSNGKRQVSLEMISYGWVSNALAHYQLKEEDRNGAEYVLRFGFNKVNSFHLTRIFPFVFKGTFPKVLHLKAVEIK